LLYPQPCLACGTILTTTEDSICTSCIINLPKTNYHLHNENPLNKIFWGRVSIEMVAAYYFFNKGNKVQNLLHQLKYKGAKNVGEKIGLLYGYELLEFNNFKDVDFIVPVPLHPKKLKKRGYNQSESFANGLAQSLKKEVVTNLLLRTVNSETQTKKSRFNRWENVATIFTISNASAIEGKHVLLVDDVITTGATIEGCAQLLTQNNATVSVVTIACA
ncbi:MAG: ComF family protein, partial [Flavobacteriales bacterium]|nr:ComF family protein [Flavobacteriales bacterium]